jgi:hypothetical protein
MGIIVKEEHLKPWRPTAESVTAVQAKVADRRLRLQAILDGMAAIEAAVAELDAVVLVGLLADGETNYDYNARREYAGGWSSAVLFKYGYMPFLEIRAPGNNHELVSRLLQAIEGDLSYSEGLDACRPDQEPGTILIGLNPEA